MSFLIKHRILTLWLVSAALLFTACSQNLYTLRTINKNADITLQAAQHADNNVYSTVLAKSDTSINQESHALAESVKDKPEKSTTKTTIVKLLEKSNPANLNQFKNNVLPSTALLKTSKHSSENSIAKRRYINWNMIIFYACVILVGIGGSIMVYLYYDQQIGAVLFVFFAWMALYAAKII